MLVSSFIIPCSVSDIQPSHVFPPAFRPRLVVVVYSGRRLGCVVPVYQKIGCHFHSHANGDVAHGIGDGDLSAGGGFILVKD